MSAPEQHHGADGRSFSELLRTANPWITALGALSAVLVLGGVIASIVGIDTMGHYGAVLGQIPEFDAAAALTAVGITAVALGMLVGAAWLIVNAVRWRPDPDRPSLPSGPAEVQQRG